MRLAVSVNPEAAVLQSSTRTDCGPVGPEASMMRSINQAGRQAGYKPGRQTGREGLNQAGR